jgi:hypothetical protein
MPTRPPKEFAVGDIFQKKRYRIPLYQRNYAWEQAQTTQLIRDIWDFRHKKQPYYIGTLVVYKRKEEGNTIYETIDGQQRLTTLHLLLSVLNHKFGLNPEQAYADAIAFENRPLSSATLPAIARLGIATGELDIDGKMQQAFLDMSKELTGLANGKPAELQQFFEYLRKQVRLLRVEVPHDTNLNHYFEVMNNRGEQLEKHEILKATMLGYLKNSVDQTRAFAQIWDACSVMDRYMVMGFPRELRDKLFSRKGEAWDQVPADFMAVKVNIKAYQTGRPAIRNVKTSLISLINGSKPRVTPETIDTEPIPRFTSVVTFPNFLLHVLRAMTGRDVKLDDKQLLPEFELALKRENGNAGFVREFGYQLLRLRMMLDNYVIKREQTDKKESWALQTIRPTSVSSFYYAGTFGSNIQQDRLVMLLSMFHVSFPQPIYKHWLSGVMRYFYLHDKSRLAATKFITYLESLSDAFYFDRFGKKELKFYNIIFKNDSIAHQAKIRTDLLNLGTGVQNFIFNRLDYLIWKAIKVDGDKSYKISDLEEFEFTFRSSVEHFYPQNPHANIAIWPQDLLDSFGNLCLISSHRNSTLNNSLPMAKEEHYRASGTIESLKQKLMLAKASKWAAPVVESHQADMIHLLRNGKSLVQ